MPAGGYQAASDNNENVVAGCYATILPIRQVTVGCHILIYFQISFFCADAEVMIRMILSLNREGNYAPKGIFF